MAQPSPTWNTKTVKITYRNLFTKNLEPGTWVATATGRITNTLSDGSTQVFRSGKIDSGPLNVAEGLPSLRVDLPIVDDPDNAPQGGEIILVINFNPNGSETFHLSPKLDWPDVTDLALQLNPDVVPTAPPLVLLGVAGGAAKLSADGKVLDAAGNIVGGTGTGLPSGGTAGQLMVRTTSGYGWIDAPTGGSTIPAGTPREIRAASGGTGSYTARPATTDPIHFFGFNPPGNDGSVLGGGGMVPNLDQWFPWQAQ